MIWLNVWEGLTKWVFKCEMSHVLQQFPIKLFLDAFVYNSPGLYYLIYVLSDRKRVLKLLFNSASK